jgi:4-amino-4-deoxy-L-arabinose transferase-like glycosyltransferase
MADLDVGPPALPGTSSARAWIVAGMAFAVLALAAWVWLARDARPPEWDHANHLERAVLCARDLKTGDVRAILERSSFYPPLVLCLTGAASMVMPVEAAAGLVMLAFLALGMAATCELGLMLGREATGLTAALLFGTAPFVVYSTLRLQLDLPLAAMVTLALLVLLATDDLRRHRATLLFGIVGGLGILTKPTFVLYVLPPALWCLARGRRRAVPGALLALLVASLVSLPWLGPRLMGLGAQLDARAFAQAAEAGHPEALTVASLAFYPRWLGYEVGFGAIVLALGGLLAMLRRRRWFLPVALLAPFLVLELIQNKNHRYALPLTASLALLAALGLRAVPRRPRRILAGALLVLGVLQVSAVMAAVPRNVWIPGLATWWVPASPPARPQWHHREILALLDRERAGAPATVSIVPNVDAFSVSNFRFYALRDRLDLRFVRAWDDPPLGIDFMVLKTGEQGPSWTAEKSRRDTERLGSDPHLARVFPVIGRFPLPDGSTATVRVRRVPAVTDASPEALASAVETGLRRRLDEVARDVEGLTIRLTHDDDIRRGRVRRVEIGALAATLGEYARPQTARLRVRELALTLEDLLVNPWSALDGARLDPLDAGRLRLDRARVAMTDLQAFVAGLKHFRRASVAAAGDALAITLPLAGPDVSARIRMLPASDRPFALLAEGVRVGGVPVPDLLVNWVVRNFDPTPRLASRMPFPVEIGRVAVRDDALTIGSEP